MVAAKTKSRRARTRAERGTDVGSFMARLVHPHKPAIEAIRQIVRGTGSVTIDDPDGLLTWLAKDRAMVVFADATRVREQKTALEHIVRQWIRHV